MKWYKIRFILEMIGLALAAIVAIWAYATYVLPLAFPDEPTPVSQYDRCVKDHGTWARSADKSVSADYCILDNRRP